MVTMQVESTEYLFIGVSGDVPSVGAEVAFLPSGVRPTTWETATVVSEDTDPLWADALASGVTGDYFVAILVGAFGGTGVVLPTGDYQTWLRLTDAVEQPVRIAPVALEVEG
jgi:membrane carboxypeptidase/penicillin-binding protein PbpC